MMDFEGLTTQSAEEVVRKRRAHVLLRDSRTEEGILSVPEDRETFRRDATVDILCKAMDMQVKTGSHIAILIMTDDMEAGAQEQICYTSSGGDLKSLSYFFDVNREVVMLPNSSPDEDDASLKRRVQSQVVAAKYYACQDYVGPKENEPSCMPTEMPPKRRHVSARRLGDAQSAGSGLDTQTTTTATVQKGRRSSRKRVEIGEGRIKGRPRGMVIKASASMQRTGLSTPETFAFGSSGILKDCGSGNAVVCKAMIYSCNQVKCGFCKRLVCVRHVQYIAMRNQSPLHPEREYFSMCSQCYVEPAYKAEDKSDEEVATIMVAFIMGDKYDGLVHRNVPHASTLTLPPTPADDFYNIITEGLDTMVGMAEALAQPHPAAPCFGQPIQPPFYTTSPFGGYTNIAATGDAPFYNPMQSVYPRENIIIAPSPMSYDGTLTPTEQATCPNENSTPNTFPGSCLAALSSCLQPQTPCADPPTHSFDPPTPTDQEECPNENSTPNTFPESCGGSPTTNFLDGGSLSRWDAMSSALPESAEEYTSPPGASCGRDLEWAKSACVAFGLSSPSTTDTSPTQAQVYTGSPNAVTKPVLCPLPDTPKGNVRVKKEYNGSFLPRPSNLDNPKLLRGLCASKNSNKSTPNKKRVGLFFK